LGPGSRTNGSLLGAFIQAMIDEPESASILLNALYTELVVGDKRCFKAADFLIGTLMSFPDDHCYPITKIQEILARADSIAYHLQNKPSGFDRRFGHGG
jgi:hypothetical protein